MAVRVGNSPIPESARRSEIFDDSAIRRRREKKPEKTFRSEFGAGTVCRTGTGIAVRCRWGNCWERSVDG